MLHEVCSSSNSKDYMIQVNSSDLLSAVSLAVVRMEVSSAKVAVRVPGDVEGLPYRGGIIVGPTRCLVVPLH
jgi:hypothetical protein